MQYTENQDSLSNDMILLFQCLMCTNNKATNYKIVELKLNTINYVQNKNMLKIFRYCDV